MSFLDQTRVEIHADSNKNILNKEEIKKLTQTRYNCIKCIKIKVCKLQST